MPRKDYLITKKIYFLESDLLLKYLLPLLLIFLSGCAISGAPVGLGGLHKVVQSNEKSVTYVYDRYLGGFSKITTEATKHCTQYGKLPIPTTNANQGFTLSSQTFECK